VHYLVNAVTESAGHPAAVLLRALQPLEGLDLMRARRTRLRRHGAPSPSDAELCRGPGNLTGALGIDLKENRLDLCGSRLVIEDRGPDPLVIAWTPRIGLRVGTEPCWRAIVRDHPAVSGPRSFNRQGRSDPDSAGLSG
jgi:DNA-3-methyladenine glycosylase